MICTRCGFAFLPKLFVFLFLFVLASTNFLLAQADLGVYKGEWEGDLPSITTFNFNISLEKLPGELCMFTIANAEGKLQKTVPFKAGELTEVRFSDKLSFQGQMNADMSGISGFVHAGSILYHVQLARERENFYAGKWNLFMVEQLLSRQMYLDIEEVGIDQHEAYPMFVDQRFRGTWATNFERDENILRFDDLRQGLQFYCKLNYGEILMDIRLAGTTVAQVSLARCKRAIDLGAGEVGDKAETTVPAKLKDDISVTNVTEAGLNTAHLLRMEDSIAAKALTFVHSVLVAKGGQLAYENYFYGFKRGLPHDTRSASKSIFSAVTGIAIDEKLLPGVEAKLYDYLPEDYQDTKDDLKGEIRLQDLLTMSSGLDAIDFGTDKPSVASEDNYQNSPDWLRTVLEAKMLSKPGAHANYASANPFLLGVAVDAAVGTRLDAYIDRKLLAPLGIQNYVLQTDNFGKPYFGGGVFMTSRDLLKFGLLYANKGEWNGQRIVSEKWVEASMKNYKVLENTSEKNGYGYLWWHETYKIGDHEYHAVEARGAGGQYISIVPELDVVFVITSGNYRNGRYWQPTQMVREYLLPSVVK